MSMREESLEEVDAGSIVERRAILSSFVGGWWRLKVVSSRYDVS